MLGRGKGSAENKAKKAEEAAQRAEELAEQARQAAEEAKAALREATGAESSSDTEPDVAAETEAVPQAETSAQADAHAEVDADVEPEVDAESDVDTESDVDAETPADPDTATDAETVADAGPVSEAETLADTDSVTDAEAEAEVAAEAIAITQTEEPADAGDDGDGDDGGDDGGDVGDGGQGRARRGLGALRGLGAVAGVLVLVNLVLAGALVWLFMSKGDTDSMKEARKQATYAATQAAQDLSSYDYRTLDSDFRRAASHTTGKFRTEFEAQTQRVKATAQQSQAVVEGTAIKTGIEETSEKQVIALVFLNQQTVKTASAERLPSQFTLRLTMKKVGDRWLVEKLQVL